MRDAFNRVDRTVYRDFASQPSSPVLEPERIKNISSQTRQYFYYKFIRGLSPDNKKRAEEFGIKKPLKEIVKYLVRDQKYKMGELKQGSESVREFYEKLERLRKLSGCDLRKKIFCGISPTNQESEAVSITIHLLTNLTFSDKILRSIYKMHTAKLLDQLTQELIKNLSIQDLYNCHNINDTWKKEVLSLELFRRLRMEILNIGILYSMSCRRLAKQTGHISGSQAPPSKIININRNHTNQLGKLNIDLDFDVTELLGLYHNLSTVPEVGDHRPRVAQISAQ
ncbi:hypothetical protein RhiirC2_774021 [Rhizophagus irregularis]|uniref:Uncharacterized protein n=1 Tax=Rhizophagus irregularis TaxID=588596 RepID=A0A2N1NMM4_9GLOM|nr:hypothetical protein RhiirC2_774021 [Rhizophagus irregularis]